MHGLYLRSEALIANINGMARYVKIAQLALCRRSGNPTGHHPAQVGATMVTSDPSTHSPDQPETPTGSTAPGVPTRQAGHHRNPNERPTGRDTSGTQLTPTHAPGPSKVGRTPMSVQNPGGRRAAPEPTDPVLSTPRSKREKCAVWSWPAAPMTRSGEVSRPESLGGMCHWAKNAFAWKLTPRRGWVQLTRRP